MNKIPVKLIIGGDFVPTKSNEELFKTGNIYDLFGEECVRLFEEADLRIVNLETPLTDRLNPLIKCGPNLIAPTATINGMKKLGLDLVGLSNNHCMDQSSSGLQDTLMILKQNCISSVGAGVSLQEASKCFYKVIRDIKIGVYACAEHEFTIAGISEPGANPFDPLESIDHIKKAKESCDYLIILYHGGIEHYRYPSPNLKRIAHKMVDSGADIVVMQHSHCIGAHESYHNGDILYGQGNFIFDRQDNEFWETGLLVEINLSEKGSDIQYHPLIKQRNTVRLAQKQKEEILRQFNQRSEDVLDDDKIKQLYVEYARSSLIGYEAHLGGRFTQNLIFRALNKLTHHKLIKMFYTNKDLLSIVDYLKCEAHNEILVTACIDQAMRKGNDKHEKK